MLRNLISKSLPALFCGMASMPLNAQGTYTHTLPNLTGPQISNWAVITFPGTLPTFGDATLSFYWLACYNSGPGSSVAIEFRTGSDTYVPVYAESGNTNSCTTFQRSATVPASTLNAAMAYAGGTAIEARARILYGCSAGMSCPFTSFAVLGNLKLSYTAQVANFSSGNSSVCPGDIVQFHNASLGAPTSFSWDFPGGVPATSSSSDPVVQYASPGVFSVSLTITTAQGNSTITKANHVVVHEPPAAFAGLDRVVCPGTSAQLQASGGVSYQWMPATGLSDPTIANPVASPAGTIGYTVVVTSAQGCQATDVMQVAVVPAPQVTITMDMDVICAGDSLLITAMGADLYSWKPDLFISSASGSAVEVWPPAPFQWTVVGTTLAGCKDSVVVDVDVKALPQVPVISFNGEALVASGQADGHQWFLEGAPISTGTASAWVPQANGNYQVVAINGPGCVVSSAPFFFGSMGASDGVQDGLLRLFPQPATDRLTVLGLVPGTGLTVLDANGRVVKTEGVSGAAHVLSVAALPPGLFVLVADDGLQIRRVMFTVEGR